MDFLDLVRTRQSVRRYIGRPVEPDKLEKMIEAVRLAPSASNSQPWTLVIVNDPELKTNLARATITRAVSLNKFAQEAPLFVVFVIEKPKHITQIAASIKNREFPLIDIGIAAEHFCLQAAALGLGTCMIGWFNEKKVRQLLGIPANKRIGLIISVGYAPEDYPLRKKIRKPVEEMSRYNKY